MRCEPADQQHVNGEHAGEHEPWDERGGEQRADRLAGNVREQDEHQARRYDLAECAGGADGAAGELLTVPASDEHRQREQAEGDHGRADDAGGGSHEHAHADDT